MNTFANLSRQIRLERATGSRLLSRRLPMDLGKRSGGLVDRVQYDDGPSPSLSLNVPAQLRIRWTGSILGIDVPQYRGPVSGARDCGQERGVVGAIGRTEVPETSPGRDPTPRGAVIEEFPPHLIRGEIDQPLVVHPVAAHRVLLRHRSTGKRRVFLHANARREEPLGPSGHAGCRGSASRPVRSCNRRTSKRHVPGPPRPGTAPGAASRCGYRRRDDGSSSVRSPVHIDRRFPEASRAQRSREES